MYLKAVVFVLEFYRRNFFNVHLKTKKIEI